uniref:Chromo domain-containing protein n=1 Tax=Peronospora matthiolae TaxID=2874970 RepID=A0AAV1TTY2_9STRA
MDSSGGQRFLVDRILYHRDLVRWRDHPPAWDSWEPRAQLIVDGPGSRRAIRRDPTAAFEEGPSENDLLEREYRNCKVSIPSAILEKDRALQ